tara:strand:- start:496 stop:693 length:198 start_codon:yes stop_codon:yes gene_type:complete
MLMEVLGDRGVWSGGVGVVSSHALANIEKINQSFHLIGHIGAIIVSVLWIIYIWKKIKKLKDGED